MADIVPQVLLVTSWISNWREKRRQKRDMKAVSKGQSLLYFRPVTIADLERINDMEVRV